jgi:hypothetical protein
MRILHLQNNRPRTVWPPKVRSRKVWRRKVRPRKVRNTKGRGTKGPAVKGPEEKVRMQKVLHCLFPQKWLDYHHFLAMIGGYPYTGRDVGEGGDTFTGF